MQQNDDLTIIQKFSFRKLFGRIRKEWLMVICVLLIFLMMLWFNFNTAEIIQFQSKQCNDHWKNQLKEKCPHLAWQPYDWLGANMTDFPKTQEGG